jgi:hypothetical protein
MGIDCFEKRLRETRELGIQLQVDASGEKTYAFKQTFNVRIRDLEAVDAETRRNFGKLLRELRAHFAQVLELEIVVLQQPGIHYTVLADARSATRTLPVSRSISVRISSSRGIGCAHR